MPACSSSADIELIVQVPCWNLYGRDTSCTQINYRCSLGAGMKSARWPVGDFGNHCVGHCHQRLGLIRITVYNAKTALREIGYRLHVAHSSGSRSHSERVAVTQDEVFNIALFYLPHGEQLAIESGVPGGYP